MQNKKTEQRSYNNMVRFLEKSIQFFIIWGNALMTFQRYILTTKG